MEMLRFVLKSFLKRKLLVVAYIVIFAAFHVINLQQLPLVEELSYGEYLFRTQDYGLYGFMFFLFFALEYFGYAEQVSISETLSVYYPLGIIAQVWQLAVMLGLILILAATNAVYQFAAYFMASMDNLPLLAHAMEAVLLNTMMPMILAAMIGAAVSYCRNRATAYGILTVITIAVSPLLGDFITVLNYYIDAYEIWDYISVLADPLLFNPDFMYGLALEDYRWNLVLFWCCLFGALLAAGLWKNRGRTAVWLCAVLLIAAGFQFSGVLQMKDRDSVLIQDSRKNGILNSDFYYWKAHDSMAEEASFEVLSYEMKLDIDRCLEADVSVAVTPSTDRGLYKFTLWYGYEIDSVTDEEGNALPFVRNGIYVEVTYDCPAAEGEIRFRYSGNGNRYYSNDQAIVLPGYIPYYPMAGFVDMWDDKQGAVIVHTDQPEKAFVVTVHSDLPLITNLEQTGDHTYSGTVSTVSIFGGFMEVVEENGYTYMQTIMEPQKIDIDMLEEKVGADLSDKVIMCLPTTTTISSRSNSENSYILFEDHIIFNDYSGRWVTIRVS